MLSSTSIFFAVLIVSFSSVDASSSPGVFVKPQVQ